MYDSGYYGPFRSSRSLRCYLTLGKLVSLDPFGGLGFFSKIGGLDNVSSILDSYG